MNRPRVSAAAALATLTLALPAPAPAETGASLADDVPPEATRPGGSDDPAVLRELAERRYLDGDLEESARLYRELGERSPLPAERARALLTGAWLEHLLLREERALTGLSRALAADPELEFTPELFDPSFAELFERARRGSALDRERRAAARTRDALAHLRAGRPEAARRDLELALRDAPDDPLALYNLALIDLESGDSVSALAGFARAIAGARKDPSQRGRQIEARAMASIGLIHYRQGRDEEAAEALARALDLDPADAAAWKNLGLTRLRQEEPLAAVEAFGEAMLLDAGDPELPRSLNRALALLPAATEPAPPATEALPTGDLPVTPVVRRESPVPTGNPVSRPVQPKRVGLKFADLDYRKLGLRGALVKEVSKKSPAARAGLRKGDLLLKIDAYEIVSDKDYFQYLRRNPPRGELEVEFLRDGTPRSATLDLSRL